MVVFGWGIIAMEVVTRVPGIVSYQVTNSVPNRVAKLCTFRLFPKQNRQ